MKNKKIILFFVILVSLNFFVVVMQPTQSQPHSEIQVVEETEIPVEYLSAQDIENKFDQIYQMPYVLDLGNTKTVSEFYELGYGDCDDKSRAFATYLVENGCEEVYVIHCTGESLPYGHAYVIYEGYAYDLFDGTYKVDQIEYKEQLEELGYTEFVAEQY